MNRQKNESRDGQKSPLDFRIVLSRMESEIVRGKDLAGSRRILGREDIWKRLDPERQLRWARMAQMAGEVELALKVLSHINRECPRLSEAWMEHLELLAILGRETRAAEVLASSRMYIGEERHRLWSGLCSGTQRREEEDLGGVFAPFEDLKQRNMAIQRYLDLFSGREDCFARQWVDKAEDKQGYVPVRRPMAERDVEEHLSGKKTYGIYLLRSDSTVRTAVIDVDIDAKFRRGKLTQEDRNIIRRERSYVFARIKELAREAGLAPVAEFSGGKGYHFWFLFETPVEAARVRRPLEVIRRTLCKDLSAFHLEVFPKQDHLSGKGLGNLVKLPLGIHRLTGKRSHFVECSDRSTDVQLEFLGKVERTRPDRILRLPGGRKPPELFIHPRMKKWADEYPELMALESLCPPLGQIIASCRNGSALSVREERVIFQTIGFLPKAKSLLHHLISSVPEYNPHLVDYKLSRLRGKPLGCKRIHSMMGFEGDVCPFQRKGEYAHPLLHVEGWNEGLHVHSEKVENLSSALENLKAAITRAQAFLK